MFTGLIRELASVSSFSNGILTINASYTPKIGDSIAINGACLTAVKIGKNNFSVELSPESQKTLAIQNYSGLVHIEPAMMMGDRFEGHIVQGHVDCVGTIKSIKKNGNSIDFFISISNEYLKYVIPKGSITVDGVSLTVNEVFEDSFRLTIIPHTVNNTLFKNYKINSKVNIETDMFARYIYNMFKPKNSDDKLSWDDVDKIMANY
ncbi:MAG: riboflavin synthase [Campylobacterota bacterium]|nr:riboflavin synthase [Campylobacterota bacterium]